MACTSWQDIISVSSIHEDFLPVRLVVVPSSPLCGKPGFEVCQDTAQAGDIILMPDEENNMLIHHMTTVGVGYGVSKFHNVLLPCIVHRKCKYYILRHISDCFLHWPPSKMTKLCRKFNSWGSGSLVHIPNLVMNLRKMQVIITLGRFKLIAESAAIELCQKFSKDGGSSSDMNLSCGDGKTTQSTDLARDQSRQSSMIHSHKNVTEHAEGRVNSIVTKATSQPKSKDRKRKTERKKINSLNTKTPQSISAEWSDFLELQPSNECTLVPPHTSSVLSYLDRVRGELKKRLSEASQLPIRTNNLVTIDEKANDHKVSEATVIVTASMIPKIEGMESTQSISTATSSQPTSASQSGKHNKPVVTLECSQPSSTPQSERQNQLQVIEETSWPNSAPQSGRHGQLTVKMGCSQASSLPQSEIECAHPASAGCSQPIPNFQLEKHDPLTVTAGFSKPGSSQAENHVKLSLNTGPVQPSSKPLLERHERDSESPATGRSKLPNSASLTYDQLPSGVGLFDCAKRFGGYPSWVTPSTADVNVMPATSSCQLPLPVTQKTKALVPVTKRCKKSPPVTCVEKTTPLLPVKACMSNRSKTPSPCPPRNEETCNDCFTLEQLLIADHFPSARKLTSVSPGIDNDISSPKVSNFGQRISSTDTTMPSDNTCSEVLFAPSVKCNSTGHDVATWYSVPVQPAVTQLVESSQCPSMAISDSSLQVYPKSISNMQSSAAVKSSGQHGTCPCGHMNRLAKTPCTVSRPNYSAVQDYPTHALDMATQTGSAHSTSLRMAAERWRTDAASLAMLDQKDSADTASMNLSAQTRRVDSISTTMAAAQRACINVNQNLSIPELATPGCDVTSMGIPNEPIDLSASATAEATDLSTPAKRTKLHYCTHSSGLPLGLQDDMGSLLTAADTQLQGVFVKLKNEIRWAQALVDDVQRELSETRREKNQLEKVMSKLNRNMTHMSGFG